MAFEKLNTDISFVSKLPDEPNEALGLSADELKAEFDKAGNAIKEYINTVLLTALELNGAVNIGIENVPGITDATTVQMALTSIVELIKNISVGALPDKSVDAKKIADKTLTELQLANGAVTSSILAKDCVTTEKLAPKSVGNGKIDNGAVNEAAIASNAVTSAKIKDGEIKSSKIADGAVGTNKLDDLSVTASKIFPSAIGTSAIKDSSITPIKLSDEVSKKFAPAYTFGTVDKVPGSPSSEPEGTIYWVIKEA